MLIHATLIVVISAALVSKSLADSYDPCCSFPCQNVGVCLSSGNNYECDCTGTGYYGDQCQTPFISTRIKRSLKPSKESISYLLTHYQWLWDIINSLMPVRRFLMKTVLILKIGPIAEPSPYIGTDSYPTWNTYTNKSVYARTLPPIPENCPTPMGVKGPKVLPDAQTMARKLFVRRKFIPCPEHTSVIFPLFAQHFTHQFFKTKSPEGVPHQTGEHGIDLSHIYGDTDERQRELRLLKDGKMKYSIIRGEMFPPLMKDANVSMFGSEKVSPEYRFAFGHSGFLVSPTFLIFSTLFLREHNRICDELMEMHPTWDDERMFQTARLILTGETIKIVVEEYVQHMSGFNFKLLFEPDLLHGMVFSYHNQVHTEFHLLYKWHSLVPDYFRIDGEDIGVRSLFYNHSVFVEKGMETLMSNFAKQTAGLVQGGKNQGRDTIAVLIQNIKNGRKLRIQSFNQYRIKFGMSRVKSFAELTGEKEISKELEEMYGDIDALEFAVGVYLQKRKNHAMFGETMAETGAPYSLKGLYGNPIASPGWWKPSTFGGERGFNIIKTASLQKLVCLNVKGCPKVSFRVPDDEEQDQSETKDKPQNESNMADEMMKAVSGKEVQSLGGGKEYARDAMPQSAKQDSKSTGDAPKPTKNEL